MKRVVLGVIAAATLLLAGCATYVLAPGAADVKIVQNATDVAACTAVGNVRQPPDQLVDLRNLTVGVGGNTLFVTEQGTVGAKAIVSGVAYRCPN